MDRHVAIEAQLETVCGEKGALWQSLHLTYQTRTKNFEPALDNRGSGESGEMSYAASFGLDACSQPVYSPYELREADTPASEGQEDSAYECSGHNHRDGVDVGKDPEAEG